MNVCFNFSVNLNLIQTKNLSIIKNRFYYHNVSRLHKHAFSEKDKGYIPKIDHTQKCDITNIDKINFAESQNDG